MVIGPVTWFGAIDMTKTQAIYPWNCAYQVIGFYQPSHQFQWVPCFLVILIEQPASNEENFWAMERRATFSLHRCSKTWRTAGVGL